MTWPPSVGHSGWTDLPSAQRLPRRRLRTFLARRSVVMMLVTLYSSLNSRLMREAMATSRRATGNSLVLSQSTGTTTTLGGGGVAERFSVSAAYAEAMSDLPEKARRAFDAHDAFDAGEEGYELRTTAFEGRVAATETDGWALRYTLTVRAPTLDAAVEEDVGTNLQEGWFETFELRLEDAPGAVRESVDVEAIDVTTAGEDAVATFEFTFGNADRAPEVTKAFAEYVEGTYMEGVVPGFTYRPPVADLLSQARQSEESGSGPMPL